jgi:hypothetical protein
VNIFAVEDQTRIPGADDLSGSRCFPGRDAKVVIVSSRDAPKPTAVNLRKIGTAAQTTELLWREVQL